MPRPKGSRHPEIWKSGPDPVHHRLFNDCQRARAQAWYRGEEWTITEQQYIDLWLYNDSHLRKSRTKDGLCLSRIDLEKGWHLDNVEIIERRESMRRSGRVGPKRGHHVPIRFRSTTTT